MEPTEARRRLEEEAQRLREMRAEQDEQGSLQGDPTELTQLTQHPGDLGSEVFEQEKEMAVADLLEEQLAEVEAALERIDAGTYGTCQLCGEPIGEDRLEARPASRYCVTHQQERERMSR
jgi:RNA polymerase-binding transcription factor DksA